MNSDGGELISCQLSALSNRGPNSIGMNFVIDLMRGQGRQQCSEDPILSLWPNKFCFKTYLKHFIVLFAEIALLLLIAAFIQNVRR